MGDDFGVSPDKTGGCAASCGAGWIFKRPAESVGEKHGGTPLWSVLLLPILCTRKRLAVSQKAGREGKILFSGQNVVSSLDTPGTIRLDSLQQTRPAVQSAAMVCEPMV